MRARAIAIGVRMGGIGTSPPSAHDDVGAVGARARRVVARQQRLLLRRSACPTTRRSVARARSVAHASTRRSSTSDTRSRARRAAAGGRARRRGARGAAPARPRRAPPSSTIAPKRSGVILPEQLQVTRMPPARDQPQRAQVELLVGALGGAERALALGQRRRIDDHHVEARAPRPRARAADRRRWPARRVTCARPLRAALARARSTAGAASSSASTDVAPPRASASAKPP